jgi:hypothetical protein
LPRMKAKDAEGRAWLYRHKGGEIMKESGGYRTRTGGRGKEVAKRREKR